MLGRDYKNNVSKIAKHLHWTEAKVQAAINYARAFPEEIRMALANNDSMDTEALFKMLPQTKEFVASKRSGA